MSSLADEIVIEPNTKKGRHEDEDRLGGLPDCVLLHVLSFLNVKHAVRTCVLSKRWKHLWKRIPTLLLHSSQFSTIKSFDKFVFRVMSLRDESIALHTLDFNRRCNSEPPILRKIASYIFSHRAQLQQLIISVTGDGSLILPCISSCRALTSLTLAIDPKNCLYTREKTLFPKSLSLPALTTLNLYNFAFCASDNADRAEPFSAFNSLNSLTIRWCTVRDAQILSISSATLVSLTMIDGSSAFTKIEFSAPNLSTFTFDGIPYQKLCGSTLSSVKQLDIDAETNFPFGDPSILLSWLLDLPNIESLIVTSDTLLVLSLVPDLLNVKIPLLCNLKSLKVKLKPLSIEAPIYLEEVMLKNKSRKEAAKIKKAFKTGLEPAATIPDRIVGFLLQNSPSAEVRMIDRWRSRTRTIPY